ncbi:GntR family transcriptional regulator [Streptomyces sp. WAC8370]|uniref:GntR family transcriptional regulator n=1 Tax=Streptomyces sp. WAC8370 TaxID=3351348 RepID=UPI003F79B486
MHSSPRSAAAQAQDALPFTLDRHSPVPLHHQVARHLEAAIENRVLAPGELLGSEIDLSVRLGVSRTTARRAVQTLVGLGLLVRHRGVGTQVVHGQAARPLELSSLYDDLDAAGQAPATRLLRHEQIPAGPEAAAALGIPEGTEVTHLERLRSARGQPVARLHNYLPTAVPDLDAALLEASGLYRLLRSAGITLCGARQTIGARTATGEEAELLGEPEGSVLLTVQRAAYDDTGRVVEYGTHLYRASRYTFDFRLLARP